MLLANWPWSVFNVTDQGFDGSSMLISANLSKVVEGKISTISEFANNTRSFFKTIAEYHKTFLF